MTTKPVKQYSRRGKDTSGETFDLWVGKVAYALNNLDDRSMLNRSSLAHLEYVKRMAREKYGSHLLPRGFALREILLECIDKVVSEVGSEPGLSRACQYLELLTRGLTRRQISSQIGLSREHTSRVYRKKALELLTEEFLTTVRNGG